MLYIQARYLLEVHCTLGAVCATFVVWFVLQLPIIWTYEVAIIAEGSGVHVYAPAVCSTSSRPRRIVVLEKSPIVLDDHRAPIYKSLSLTLDHKVLENCPGLRILQTVCY